MSNYAEDAACSVYSGFQPWLELRRTEVNKEKIRIGMRSGYAPVNGLKLYYEINGAPNASCSPLVLLHGGGDMIQTSFGDYAGTCT
jgi:hypothetical protein